jgi:hypothetical protein
MPDAEVASAIAVGLLGLSMTWAALELGVGWLTAAARTSIQGEGPDA